MRFNDLPPRSRLFRTSDGAKVLGVCGGLADYFGFDRGIVRAATAVSALFFPTIIIAYFILGIILEQSPQQERSSSIYERELRRRVRSAPQSTLQSQRHRFRDLDRRLQRLEKYVTSKRFRLDREFDGLRERRGE
ncbi:MAG: PspC domain-containing protein [Gammaproteobacteria bacterium]|jgi:phage shock protein C